MDPIAALEETYNFAGRIVAGVTVDQLDDPTGCPKWTVRDLLAHLIQNVGVFVIVAEGGAPVPPADAPRFGDDPGSAFAVVAKRSLDAWRQPQALERTVQFSIGELPGEVAVRFNIQEVLAHAWDLAKSTGQDATLPPEVASAALAFARDAIKPEFRNPNGDPIGPPVDLPPDAPISDQFAAFMGRHL
jgi:uncharacterized protein (TIGR03086 family)